MHNSGLSPHKQQFSAGYPEPSGFLGVEFEQIIAFCKGLSIQKKRQAVA